MYSIHTTNTYHNTCHNTCQYIVCVLACIAFQYMPIRAYSNHRRLCQRFLLLFSMKISTIPACKKDFRAYGIENCFIFKQWTKLLKIASQTMFENCLCKHIIQPISTLQSLCFQIYFWEFSTSQPEEKYGHFNRVQSAPRLYNCYNLCPRAQIVQA